MHLNILRHTVTVLWLTSSVFSIGTLSSSASYILRLLNAFFSTIRRNVDRSYRHIHTHTNHTRLTALFPGLPGWAGTRKVKPIWISLKQETVSGSGISWAICKSAPRSRQITTPAPYRSDFYRPDALPAAQPTASKHWRRNHYNINNVYFWLQFLRFQFSEDFVNKMIVYFLYYFILKMWRPHPQMHETAAEYAVCDWTEFIELPKASLTSLTLYSKSTCWRFQGLRWFSMIFISQ